MKKIISLATAKVDMLCISENRLSKNNLATTNLDIPGNSNEHTPIVLLPGAILIYILQKDLKIYSLKELK